MLCSLSCARLTLSSMIIQLESSVQCEATSSRVKTAVAVMSRGVSRRTSREHVHSARDERA